MGEKELLELLKKGDHSALRQIFNSSHLSLCQLAFNMVRDKDEAKDIVQEVFIKLWRNRSQLDIAGSLGPYLRRAVVNTALNSLERAGRMHLDISSAQELKFSAASASEDSLSYRELERRANDAISSLPSRTRIVFTLIRTDEMSYKEVAETLQISVKAVEKEMMRALRLLREALKDYLNASLLIILMQQF